MYRPVPLAEIVDAVRHLRELHQQMLPRSAEEQRIAEHREILSRHLISNLRRTGSHPTLALLSEVARAFSLTVEGAHRLFGYDIDGIREFDLRLNGGRTHIIESHIFERDLRVDYPASLATFDGLQDDVLLDDLVRDWKESLPIRSLSEAEPGRSRPFYIHVGTEDSLGSSLPPGAIALVEPIDSREERQPNAANMYLLQFSDGYRCSRCVVVRNSLLLLATERTYAGPQRFAYPGLVRIVGRVRMFALALPQPEYRNRWAIPQHPLPRDLVLPWEHTTRSSLYATKHRRFRRSDQQEDAVRSTLRSLLGSKLSLRSERRYRSPTSSDPHVNALIHLTLAHVSRYTDALRSSGFVLKDSDRYSLETLLATHRIQDLPHLPTLKAEEVRLDSMRTQEKLEWPELLSFKFPHLQTCGGRILRLGQSRKLQHLDPPLTAGSLLLLDPVGALPDTRADVLKRSWARPLFVLRRNRAFTCGFLERDGNEFILDPGGDDHPSVKFSKDELQNLRRVSGVAVPV